MVNNPNKNAQGRPLKGCFDQAAERASVTAGEQIRDNKRRRKHRYISYSAVLSLIRKNSRQEYTYTLH